MGQADAVQKSAEPAVSVIIPVFNVEKYIGQCLESLLNQSYSLFEIICVDDGSDDRTADIIKEYMSSDERIRLIERPHCGKAGVMRNEGMKYARGEYCLFLDGDDFFEKDMLKESLAKAKADQADICLFDARLYNEKTKIYKEIDYILQKDYFPQEIPFEGKTSPYIFNITTGCPWSKLIRKTLIEQNNLQFMALHRSNDVYFIFMALALAKRITILPKVFVNYRQSGESLQANNAKTPWDWYEALQSLYQELKRREIYDEVEKSFKNMVFGVSIYNLCSLKTSETFSEVYNRLKTEIFSEFGLDDFKKEDCYTYNEKKYAIYMDMKQYDVQQYLFLQIMKLRQEKSYWVKRAKKAEKDIKDVKDSITFKTGKTLLSVPRKIKKALKNSD